MSGKRMMDLGLDELIGRSGAARLVAGQWILSDDANPSQSSYTPVGKFCEFFVFLLTKLIR